MASVHDCGEGCCFWVWQENSTCPPSICLAETGTCFIRDREELCLPHIVSRILGTLNHLISIRLSESLSFSFLHYCGLVRITGRCEGCWQRHNSNAWSKLFKFPAAGQHSGRTVGYTNNQINLGTVVLNYSSTAVPLTSL